jgi:hypothetical protein
MRTDTKDLDFIQAIITRLAGNSFQMKSWNIALGSAVIGIASAKDSHPNVAVLAFVPCCAIWALDGYYLGLERLYRNLYNRAIGLPAADFSLNAGELPAKTWFEMVFRPSVAGIHLPLLGIIILVSLTGILRWS